ncbi:MAG: DUF6134 family protein [Pseudomonadota bacterium]
MKIRLPAMTAALLLATGSTLASSSAFADDAMEWKFRVFLDKKEIGFHDYRITGADDAVTVDTKAEFDVKVLFFNAYSYRHQNAERWNNDCLVDIAADTDANGKDFKVRGELTNNGFEVDNGTKEQVLPNCVMSFAYWNPSMLEQTQLLNSQTGEYEAVEVVAKDTSDIDVNGVPVAAQQYDLVLEKGTISVWYSVDDQRWLALDAPAKGDRRIRYEPIAIPATQVRLSRNSDPVSDSGG